MQYKHLRKSLLAIILVLAMIFTTLCFGGVVYASKADLENKKDNLENKNDKLGEKLEDIRDDKEKEKQNNKELQAEMNKILARLSAVSQEIDDYNTEIEELDTQISSMDEKIEKSNETIKDLEAKISEKEAEFAELFELLKKRLRALYIAGDASSLEVLLTSSDMSDFLTRLEIVKGVTEHDSALLEQVKGVVSDLETSKSKVESEKLLVESTKSTVVSKRNDRNAKRAEVLKRKAEIDEDEAYLSVLIEKSNDKLDDLDEQERKNIEQQRINEDAINDLDQQIKDIISGSGSSSGGSNITTGGSAGNASNGSGTKINMIWPVQGCSTYISSPYGPRWGTIHRGIDITGGNIYGKNVVAVASGKVILALNTTTGYGRYVIVDHGNGVATLYAHCSELKVSVGQKVSQGQTIALVGSTGNSTGPHLHFEVRINGEKVNPANYVSH